MEAGFLMMRNLWLQHYWYSSVRWPAAVLLLCLGLGVAAPLMARAEVGRPPERLPAPSVSEKTLQKNRVKAAVVLNIARFVEWPAAQVAARGNRLTLCYFREDVLGEAYDVIRDRRVNGRDLRLEFIDNAEELTRCDLLLLSEREIQGEVQSPLVARDLPLLVIKDLTNLKPSERVAGAHPGVHVALVRRGSKIGFEINLSAAHDAGLKISSRLLRLAHIVGEGA